MLTECRQFHQSYADLEQWLGQVEADLDARPIRPESPQHVQTLLKEHEVGALVVVGITMGSLGITVWTRTYMYTHTLHTSTRCSNSTRRGTLGVVGIAVGHWV